MDFNVHYVADNQVSKYSDTSVTIKNQTYTTSIILTNDQIIDISEVTLIDDLAESHLELIMQNKPDLVILGSGTKIIYPNYEIQKFLRVNQISFEVMTNNALCRTYNFLISENRKIMCFILFT